MRISHGLAGAVALSMVAWVASETMADIMEGALEGSESASIAEIDAGPRIIPDRPEQQKPAFPQTQPVEGVAAEPAEEPETRLTGDWGGARRRLEDRGIAINANLTAVGFRNLRGGVDTEGTSLQHLLSLNLTFDSQRLLGLNGGTFFVDFQQQGGQSPGDEIGYYQGVSPIDADGRSQVAEIWYEQLLAGDKLRLKVGKIDANSEFDVAFYGGEFMNGGIATVANIPMPTYPDPAFGGVIEYRFTDRCFARAGVFDGAGQEGVATGDKGPATLFGDPGDLFFITETGCLWWLRSDELPGRFVIGAWHHTGTFDRFDGGSHDGTHDGTGGAYLVIEQMIIRENPGDANDQQGIGLFASYGYADAAVMEVPHHVVFGCVGYGLVPTRDDDVAGIAVTHVHFADRAGFSEDGETTVELFYTCRLAPAVSLRPDLQYIVHPGGNGAPDALAAGIAVGIDF